MSETWKGGCQCGAVRYELLQRPTGSHICHCRMCQKQFGNFFAALVGLSRDQFRVTRGVMANFKSSAEIQRGFCRDCGTPLTYEAHTRGSISVSTGSLDQHSDFPPEVQYGTEAREPWFQSLFTIPAYPSGEDENGSDDFAKLLPGISASNRQHPDHETNEWPKPNKER